MSECTKLARKECNKRYDWIGEHVHWEICGAKRILVIAKWYEHQPNSVNENETWKVPWDFAVQTDHVITARRPDLTIADKERNECRIIDFALPYNTKVDYKELEKIDSILICQRN